MSNSEVEKEVRTMYDDLDEVMLRANKALDHKADLPREYDTVEGALAKIIIIIGQLCNKIEEK